MMKRKTLVLGEIQVFVYSFELMDSRMYMIREKDEILVIDPCMDEEMLQDAAGAVRATVLLTHEHFDHISGVNWLREHFRCCVYTGAVCAERIESIRANLSSSFAFLFILDREKYDYVRHNISLPYKCKADECFTEYGELKWREHTIEIYEVGGHSPGSCFIVLDHQLLFAGDNLLENDQELRGIDADKGVYEEKVFPFLRSFDAEIYVLPGHGESRKLSAFGYKFAEKKKTEVSRML